MVFTLGSFVLVTVAVAFVSWLKTKGTDETSKDGYFLGGRSLSGLVIFGSLMMTNLSAEQLVGRNGQGYAAGMTAMGWETMCPIALTLMALFFIPKYFKLGISTIPEFLESRFDRATRVIVSFIFLVAYIVTMLPLVLYAGSVAMERIFGITALMGGNRFMATTVMCVALGIIGGIYAIFGGLKAVAVSDTVNGIGLLIGGFMIPFFALSVLGKTAGGDGLSVIDGMRFLIENHSDMLNSIAPADSLPPAVPWPTVFTGLFFLGLQSWCTHQSFIQRVLAAKNLKEAQKGALYCAFLKIIGFMYLALPGVIAYALFELQGDQVSMMDEAYPQLVAQVVPAPLMGFFAAVMLGAILSSFNSVLNSVDTMFTMDIYAEFVDRNASEDKLVKVGKNVGIIFAVLTTIVGPLIYFFPAGLKTFLDSLVMLIALPVLTAVFGGFFFKHLPKYSAKVILVLHVVCYGSFLLFLGSEFHYLYAVFVLLPLELLVMFLFNQRNRAKHPEAWEQKDVGAVDLTPWKYRWVATALILICVAAVYIAFSPLGIGTWNYPQPW